VTQDLRLFYLAFSEQAVRLQLLKEEEELLNKDKSIMLHEEVTPLAFLTAGLELSVAQSVQFFLSLVSPV
jgi:hypothetical protein